MKLYKQIIFILIVFFKTGNLLSENNIFSVNNIELNKREYKTNEALSNQAIKNGFKKLINRILLKEDVDKFSDLSFASIRDLVKYYQISGSSNRNANEELAYFNVTFDKAKIHNLFYTKEISYSEILDKEMFILPILIIKNELFIFNNNFFYDNWNKESDNELIEFILPIENIEIIQNINRNKSDILNVQIENVFEEYSNKNLSIILIEDNTNFKKVYLISKIQGKKVFKNLTVQRQKMELENFYEKIINETKKELINLVKSANLIDIRTPSFLNVKFNHNKKDNLANIKTRIKRIDSIENIYVKEFNKDYINLKIKYLGKLDQIISQLKKVNVNLQLRNNNWTIETF